MNMTDVKTAVDALASTFEDFKAANNQALQEMADKGAVDSVTADKVARLDEEIERLRDGLEHTRASLNRPIGDAKSETYGGLFGGGSLATEYKAAFGAYLRRGMESGSADILKRVTKGASPRAIAEGLAKAREAGLKVSATVILGLGGAQRWRDHIDGTAALINETAPTYLSTLQLGLDGMIEAEFLARFGEPFEPQDDAGMLTEQVSLIPQLDPPRPVIFRSNHASNALPLAGTLPKDRDALLAVLNAARAGEVALRPRHLRSH